MANTVDSTTPEALLREILDGSITGLEDDQIRLVGRNRLGGYSGCNIEYLILKAFQNFNGAIQGGFGNISKLTRFSAATYPGKDSEGGVTGEYTFRGSGDTASTVYVFPAISSSKTLPARFFSSIKADVIDLGPGVNKISTGCFITATGYNASAVNKIILRCPTIVTWTNSNAMGPLSGVVFYIPKSLYDHLGDGTANDYRAATNWSSAITSQSFTFAQIEGSAYENYYADGTPVAAS